MRRVTVYALGRDCLCVNNFCTQQGYPQNLWITFMASFLRKSVDNLLTKAHGRQGLTRHADSCGGREGLGASSKATGRGDCRKEREGGSKAFWCEARTVRWSWHRRADDRERVFRGWRCQSVTTTNRLFGRGQGIAAPLAPGQAGLTRQIACPS